MEKAIARKTLIIASKLSDFSSLIFIRCWKHHIGQPSTSFPILQTEMCYILVSTCQTCAFPIRTRHKQCEHAELHGFDPRSCPNRMKRRRRSDPGMCWKCERRRESLSCFPTHLSYDADDESEQGDGTSVEARKEARSTKGGKGRKTATKKRKQTET